MRYYSISIHRAMVDGELTDQYDLSVRYHVAHTAEEVRARLSELHSYTNGDGECVTWELVRVMTIDEFHDAESGDEVTGFTATQEELGGLV